MLFIKDLIVEDKQGIGQALKANSCQKHTSFADNFIFFKLVTRKQTVDSCHKHISFADNFIFFKLVSRKQTEHEHQHQQLKTFMQTDYLPSRQYHLQSADS